ncbi:MAG: hypothetical protein J1F09_00830 [Oscillospiraceae bacterium]|nr:hypothetical protein [Oscillospiraceae bacterium]
MYPFPSSDDKELWEDISEEYMRSSSGTDCTGLIPAAAKTDEELENYNELYDFLPTAVSDGKNDGC